MTDVKYTIELFEPLQHLFQVTIHISPKDEHPVLFELPNWIPGSYMIRDFAKHVIAPKASDHLGALTLTHQDKCRFSVKHKNQPFQVTYQYYAYDLSVRKAYLDQEFGFINPCSALYSVKGFEEKIHHIELVQPNSEEFAKWQVATGLKQIDDSEKFSWGNYQATNYQTLTDHPILFGQLDIAEFTIEDVPHYLITAGRHFGDLERVAKDLKPLCQYHCDMFNGLPEEVDQYLFLTMVTDNGFGGLEHLNSTALLCSRYDIADASTEIEDNEDYQTFLSLCSHEYLHTWNVKRLKPREFIPYQFEQEVYTKQLWFYEGMTSYFDDLSLVQTGLISKQKYLKTLGKALSRIERGQGQLNQSVLDSSFHTWSKFYQQDEAAPDQIASYYVKGAAIACMTDLILLANSNGQVNLKHIMNEAWHKFGKTNLGTTQEKLEELFLHYLPKQFHQTFIDALYNAEKLNLVEVFNDIGVTLKYQSQQDYTNFSTNAEPTVNWLGAMLTTGFPPKVKQVLNNSPAQRAGIAVSDELIAINDIKISDKSLKVLLKNNSQPYCEIRFFRKDQLLTSKLPLEPSEPFIADLQITDQEKVDWWLQI